MTVIPPVVRHMVLCEQVHRDPIQPKRLTLEGWISTIRSLDDPPFPLRYPRISVCVMVTGGRGTGTAAVVIRSADTGAVVAGTAPHPLTFGGDPLAVEGVVFNLLNCLFHEAGLYLVQFLFDDQVLAQEYLTVR